MSADPRSGGGGIAGRMVRIGLGVAALGTLAEYLLRFDRLIGADVAMAPFWGWFPDPSWPWVALLAGAWFLTAYLFLTGRYRPLSATVLGMVLFCVLLTDRQWYTNHLYLLALVVPLAGWAASDDDDLSRTARRLIGAQVLLVYLFAGIAKLNGEFLSGAVLQGYLGGLPGFEPGAFRALAGAVVGSELLVVPLLLLERTRLVGVALGVAMHGGMVAGSLPSMPLIEQLGVTNFGIAMLSCYPAVFALGDEVEVLWQGHRTPR